MSQIQINGPFKIAHRDESGRSFSRRAKVNGWLQGSLLVEIEEASLISTYQKLTLEF